MVFDDCSKIVNTCNYRIYDAGRTRDEVLNKQEVMVRNEENLDSTGHHDAYASMGTQP